MKKYIISAVVFAFALVVAGIIPNAYAHEDKSHNSRMMVNINPSGHALIRGTVDSIGTDSLVIKSWGGLWTVKVISSTRFLHDNHSPANLADLKVGDFVGVSGTADAAGNFIVNAKLLKNWEPKRNKMDKEEKRNDRESMENRTIRVSLAAVNNSGISGVATLKQEDGKLKVKLELAGALVGAVEPAHIHVGVCPGVGAVKYPLTSVVNGKSETTLMVTMADIKAGLPLSINVHKSDTEAGVYVACGEIRL